MHTPTLATRFANSTRVLRSDQPLSEEQMRHGAPSIFASAKHASRSERYTYIPTIDVLRGLQREGFEPFMVAQGQSRIEGKTEYTKHMIRLRHGRQGSVLPEANEIILINSHDGASSYQMLAGVFRFVCRNGLVVGQIANDIRIPHKGNIQHEVIDGAFRVLEEFRGVGDSVQAMNALPLQPEEQQRSSPRFRPLAGSPRAGGSGCTCVAIGGSGRCRSGSTQSRRLWCRRDGDRGLSRRTAAPPCAVDEPALSVHHAGLGQALGGANAYRPAAQAGVARHLGLGRRLPRFAPAIEVRPAARQPRASPRPA